MQQNKAKAIILFSGGLDSSTVLAIAQSQGYDCHCLSFDYDQRHQVELTAAKRITQNQGVRHHHIVKLDIGNFGGSALTDQSIDVPDADQSEETIPVTYVPARNTIFLSIALGLAETANAHHIFIGAHQYDYSHYPDCRPAFLNAFEKVANLGTKAGVEGQSFHIHAPLINMSKAEIIKLGSELGVDYSLTLSCYDPDDEGRACGRCESCAFRKKGFIEAGFPDPTRYQDEKQ